MCNVCESPLFKPAALCLTTPTFPVSIEPSRTNATFDQRAQVFLECRQVALRPVGCVMERLLHIDHEQCGFGLGFLTHGWLSWEWMTQIMLRTSHEAGERRRDNLRTDPARLS